MHATEETLTKPKHNPEANSADRQPWIKTKRQYLGLTQVCRQIRSEYLPLYKSQTIASLLPIDLYAYIDTWITPPGLRDDQITGRLMIDLFADEFEQIRVLDVKPLLQLLRRAKNLLVETYDVMEWLSNSQRSLQATLIDLYDIHDMDMFYDYLDAAMTAFEVRSSEGIGVELIFELRAGYWEEWMGEWSKPDHDPNYRIPIELEDKVVQWGRQCGMELNRSMGSHLTVNYRYGG